MKILRVYIYITVGFFHVIYIYNTISGIYTLQSGYCTYIYITVSSIAHGNQIPQNTSSKLSQRILYCKQIKINITMTIKIKS